MVGAFFGFLFTGWFSNLFAGLAFLNFDPFQAKTRYKSKSYYVEQVVRVLVGALWSFWIFDYLNVSETALNKFLAIGIPALLLLALTAIIAWDTKIKKVVRITYLFFIFGGLLPILGVFGYLTIQKPLHANELYEMVNKRVVEVNALEDALKRKHLPLVTEAGAAKKGDSLITSLDNPSAYKEGEYIQTRYENRNVFIAPIEFAKAKKAYNSKTTSGFFVVSAENPNSEAQPVEGQTLRYLKSNILEKDLERKFHDEYPNRYFFDIYTDVDNNGIMRGVAITGHYLSGKTGRIIDNVLVMNLDSGEIEEYAVGKEPEWVKRVYSMDIAMEHLSYYGDFAKGWFNASWFGPENGVVSPSGEFSETFNEKGELLYVVDLRIKVKGAGKTNSMDKYGTFNAKTGEILITDTRDGLINSTFAKETVINSGLIKEDWSPVKPSLFTAYGEETYLFPVYDAGDVYQGIALVRAHNTKNLVVFGKTTDETFRAFSRELAKLSSTEGILPPEKVQREEIIAKVIEVDSTVVGGNTIYYVKLEGIKGKVFTVNPETNQDIVMTDIGETVEVRYIGMEAKVIPVESFMNPSMWE